MGSLQFPREPLVDQGKEFNPDSYALQLAEHMGKIRAQFENNMRGRTARRTTLKTGDEGKLLRRSVQWERPTKVASKSLDSNNALKLA